MSTLEQKYFPNRWSFIFFFSLRIKINDKFVFVIAHNLLSKVFYLRGLFAHKKIFQLRPIFFCFSRGLREFLYFKVVQYCLYESLRILFFSVNFIIKLIKIVHIYAFNACKKCSDHRNLDGEKRSHMTYFFLW